MNRKFASPIIPVSLPTYLVDYRRIDVLGDYWWECIVDLTAAEFVQCGLFRGQACTKSVEDVLAEDGFSVKKWLD